MKDRQRERKRSIFGPTLFLGKGEMWLSLEVVLSFLQDTNLPTVRFSDGPCLVLPEISGVRYVATIAAIVTRHRDTETWGNSFLPFGLLPLGQQRTGISHVLGNTPCSLPKSSLSIIAISCEMDQELVQVVVLVTNLACLHHLCP